VVDAVVDPVVLLNNTGSLGFFFPYTTDATGDP
jgi:hypothetical protein